MFNPRTVTLGSDRILTHADVSRLLRSTLRTYVSHIFYSKIYNCFIFSLPRLFLSFLLSSFYSLLIPRTNDLTSYGNWVVGNYNVTVVTSDDSRFC